jgi:hypothetical protein
MKYIIAAVLVSILISGLFAGKPVNNPPATADSLFIVVYTPGSSWDFKKQPQEQAYFSNHSKMLSTLRKEGRIKIGGRYSDKGMILLQSNSLQDARSIVFGDSAVINKLFTAELFSFSAFYKGCIE